MNLSIIIPTKDRPPVLQETLNCLQKILLANTNIEAIVVNDSQETEVEFESLPNLTIVRNPKKGVASARNFGVTLARSEQILFMDDDINVDETHIKRALDFIDAHPTDCLNLDWVYPPLLLSTLQKKKFGRFMIKNELTSMKGWVKGVGWNPDAFYETNSMASHFLIMKKSVFHSIGGYNEKFPHAGFEDYDFQERIKKTGIKIFWDTRFTVYHNEFDRTEPLNWLRRGERAGETRGVAVKIFGYKEKDPGYSKTKMAIYHLLVPFRPLVYAQAYLIPNLKMFDFLYNRWMHILAGTYHFAGFGKVKSAPSQ